MFKGVSRKVRESRIIGENGILQIAGHLNRPWDTSFLEAKVFIREEV
jgi:hypothetical protein